MARSNHSLAIALCSSFVLHAMLVYFGVRAFVAGPIRLAGWDLADREQNAVVSQAQVFDPVTRLPDTSLGAEGGTGHAIDPAPGDSPLEARKGDQDQQFLSRDPEGPGKIGNDPSPSLLPLGENSQQPNPSPAPFGVASAVAPVPTSISRGSDQQQRPVTDTAEARQTSERPSTPAPPAALAPAVAQVSQKASSNLPPADPAPMAESETDPYSVAGSVRFRAGKSEVQFGRKHKLVRPRFDLAAETALLSLRSPVIIALKLDLDASGNVTHVDFIRKSGSDDIDQAISVAAYKWWLEPSKDKFGKPVADTVPFVIRLD